MEATGTSGAGSASGAVHPGGDPASRRGARAERHAALGDEVRLAVVDELSVSDRSPGELGRLVDIGSNLLAHHLDVLESVGLIERSRSSGDGRRRYVHLRPEALADLAPGRRIPLGSALFVCTANSARSQLAAALWERLTGRDASSAGTHPATAVHPGAAAAADRIGLDLGRARPRSLSDVAGRPDLVVTVCDRAHEELGPSELGAATTTLHWSVPDPVTAGDEAAFDATVAELQDRIVALVGASGAAP